MKKRWLPKLKSDVEELTAALVDAQVDLNPHQIDAAPKLKEKLAGEKQVKVLEAQRNQKRRSLFDAQDEADRQREALIAAIEGKLQQKTELVQLFAMKWSIR